MLPVHLESNHEHNREPFVSFRKDLLRVLYDGPSRSLFGNGGNGSLERESYGIEYCSLSRISSVSLELNDGDAFRIRCAWFQLFVHERYIYRLGQYGLLAVESSLVYSECVVPTTKLDLVHPFPVFFHMILRNMVLRRLWLVLFGLTSWTVSPTIRWIVYTIS